MKKKGKLLKKRRRRLVALFVAIALLAAAWYWGLVPVASSSARASLRHAMDLKMLPSGVEVNSSGMEAWTDYIFEADISINPDSFEKLLAGRDFQKSMNKMYGVEFTRAYNMPGYQGFRVAEVWYWEDVPADAPEGGIGSRCTVYTNEKRNRVFISYSSD